MHTGPLAIGVQLDTEVLVPTCDTCGPLGKTGSTRSLEGRNCLAIQLECCLAAPKGDCLVLRDGDLSDDFGCFQ